MAQKQSALAAVQNHQSAPTEAAIVLRSARQTRALDALVATRGWITREAIDRAAGCSNGPDLIRQLRQKLGYDAIEMQHFDATDRDGRACKPGYYRLSDQGRARLAELGGAPC
jgi:hypothetical protein